MRHIQQEVRHSQQETSRIQQGRMRRNQFAKLSRDERLAALLAGVISLFIPAG
jgi:hypothetical protein